MKWNPVFRRELTVSSRSIRMAAVIFVFNSVLAVVALFNMYSMMEQVRATAEIQYSRFLDLYTFVSAVEFIMLMFIMPALTASCISGERERQTLELMLTTTMEPRQMVLGKLASSLTMMLVLAVSALPVLSLVFVYGGITVMDVALLFVCYGVVAVFTGGIGMFCSSFIRRSTIATVSTYAFLVLLVAGTYAVSLFAYRMDLNELNSYALALNASVREAGSGGFLYLLLLNPAVTFYGIINGQAGSGSIRSGLSQIFGAVPENWITDHWVFVSLALQLLCAAVFIAASIWLVTPIHRGRMRRFQEAVREPACRPAKAQ